MQAIILAAGKGTRCLPLTATQPKVLLKIANHSILEHNLNQLSDLVDDVIIVIGYLGHMVKEAIGTAHGQMRIQYVEQKNVNGTGTALKATAHLIKERFLVLNGHDIYARADIKKLLHRSYAVLAAHVQDPQLWGMLETKGKRVLKIVEKPKRSSLHLANTGCCILDKDIFSTKIKKSARKEYEAVDFINNLAKDKDITYETATAWMPIGYPWQLLAANKALLSGIKTAIHGKIEKNVVVKGKLMLGKNSIIRSGTYIEGPVIIGDNCTIGPNAYIRGPASIGNACKVGQSVELKNVIMFDKSNIPHLSYIGDSVIGSNVNLGAGTTTANLRFDKKEIRSMVNKELISTGLTKLGVIIGDNVQTGIHVNLMPGVKLWPNTHIKPNEAVYQDVLK